MTTVGRHVGTGEVWINPQHDDLVAVHPLVTGKYQRHLLPEHADSLKEYAKQRELLKEAFFKLGKTAEAFYEGLLRDEARARDSTSPAS